MKSNIPLPSGFEDILSPYASERREKANLMLEHFAENGFAEARPPLVEFRGGVVEEKNSFQILDGFSNEMMVIRSDITPQIARIARNQLSDAPRPLRLSYAGEVLRMVSNDYHTERQRYQIGAEIIGIERPNEIHDDFSVIKMAFSALKKIGFEDVTLELCLPNFLEILQKDIAQETRDEIRDLVASKDIPGLKEQKASDVIHRLILPIASHQGFLETIKNMDDLPQDAVLALKMLSGLSQEIESSLSNLNLTIDVLEQRDFGYQDGIGFTFYDSATNQELGRGGRYQLSKEDGAIDHSVGFSIFLR